MKRTKWVALVWVTALAGLACSEILPTSVDDDLLPGDPVTVEVRLPWDDFAANLEVFGGFGSPQELGLGELARAFAGTLDARTLVRFAAFPRSTSVPDSTGTTRVDSVLTVTGARVVARFDTLASPPTEPVTVALGATTQEWDAWTATWDLAVDTILDRRAWGEPGAGPVQALATAVWDPAEGDTAVFELDTAQVALWADTTDVTRGARLDLLTEGARVRVTDVSLRLIVQPSINPDTLVDVTAVRELLTFVYSPRPEPPPDGIRIGGVPAWRTILDLSVPAALTGPAELCAAAGCPIPLTADRLNYAALVLWSRRSEPAFQPADSVGLDVRPVLLRSALPKAPLGSSLIGLTGRRVGPEIFGDDQGTQIEIPVTAFLQAIIEDDASSTNPPPRTLALLSTFEPSSIAFASFHGPGTLLAPVLRLIVTAGPTVKLP